jgi:hypothetical protein
MKRPKRKLFKNFRGDVRVGIDHLDNEEYIDPSESPEISLGDLTDREHVLSLLSKDGLFLENLSRSFKNDRELVLRAISQNGKSIQFASRDLKNDKSVAILAVQQNGDSLMYLSYELKCDVDIVSAAIQNKGSSIQYSEKLRKNRVFALAAVLNDPRSLLLLPNRFLYDIEFINLAIDGDDTIIEDLLNTSLRRRDLFLQVAKTHGIVFNYMKEFQADEECAIVSIQSYPHAFYCVHQVLLTNVNVFKCSMKAGISLAEFPSRFRTDKDMVRYSLEQNSFNYDHMDKSFTGIPDFIALALENPSPLQVLDIISNIPHHFKGNSSIMLKAIVRNPHVFHLASHRLRADKNFVLECVRQKPHDVMLEFFVKEMKWIDHVDVCMQAVTLDPRTFIFTSKRIRTVPEIVCHVIERNREYILDLDEETKNQRDVHCIINRMYKKLVPELSHHQDVAFIFSQE